MSNKIDFTTINKVAFPGTIIQSFNYTTDNNTYTPTVDGFIVGTCTTFANGEGYCFIDAGGVYGGGIVHMPSLNSTTDLIANFPVKAGKLVTFRVLNGRFTGGFYSVDFS